MSDHVKNVKYGDKPNASARLHVPGSRAERDELRMHVKAFAVEHDLTPPLTLEELDAHASCIIESHGLDGSNADFLKILLNNEAWLDAVAAVPFERRTLLLPPCLRSATKCQAEFDEFGLLCEQCGNCVLCGLVAEAEELGYAVLIAEGTTIVSEMIKGGMVDAVLGVSCMHSLERTYPNVYSRAVPGLAIPLLEDGCADTSVDIDWIKEALHFRTDKTARGIGDLARLHEEVSAWFEEDHLRSFLGVGSTETENISMEWLARAGKRWRPFLAVSIYEALAGSNGEPLPEKVKSLAIAVECIHKASLVYDDIQDGDDVRYGEETLYRKHGVPVALTASLYLLGLGYRLLSTCEASGQERADMLALATGGHCELCLGQGSELNWARSPSPLTVDEVLAIFRLKTAPSFDVVFRLGAVCAGADSKTHEILKNYSLDVGIAYQVQDDIDDFHGKGDVDDVACGRPSIVLALAYAGADARGKEIIARAWCDSSADVLDEARQVIKDTGAEKKAAEILEKYRKQALNALKPLKNRDLKIILYRLAGKILRTEAE